MRLTQDPNNNADVSQRHGEHLERVKDLQLARKAKVSEKLARTVREAAASGNPSLLNGLQKDKHGRDQFKYEFKAEDLWRIERAVGNESMLAGVVAHAFGERAHENGERWDLRGPRDLERDRKEEFARNDSFSHRLGSKLSKEAARSSALNAIKQAASSIGEGLRRGWKGTGNAVGGANLRHGQEYTSALTYIERLKRAGGDESARRNRAQQIEINRRLRLGEELRNATTSPDRRRLVKELLRQSTKKPAEKQAPAQSRLNRPGKPLTFGAHDVTGPVTKQRATYARASEELSLASKAGVSRKLVRTLAALFDGNTTESVVSRLNGYNPQNLKFNFKAEHLWRVQNFLNTRDQSDDAVRQLTAAVDGALTIRARHTGSEQSRGLSRTRLRRHFLDNGTKGLSKVAREASSLPLTHQLNHAAAATGEYLRRGVKSTKNWTGGGKTARHDGQFGHVHSVLEARLRRATTTQERDRVQAELDTMGTRGNPNRQAVRELYAKYSNQKRALRQEAKEDARRSKAAEQQRGSERGAESPGAAEELQRRAEYAAHRAEFEAREAASVRDQQPPADADYNQFVNAFLRTPTLNPAVTDLAWDNEQRGWDPSRREAIANEALDFLLRTPTANGHSVVSNATQPFNEGHAREFASAAVPLLQNGKSLAEVSTYMGQGNLPRFTVQNATDVLISAMHQQINLGQMGPSEEAFAAFENISALDHYLNKDDTIAFPSHWTPERQNALLHIPGVGSLRFTDRDGAVVIQDGQEYTIPADGISTGDGWHITAQGNLVTPNGWHVRLPEEKLYTHEEHLALDKEAAWNAAWQDYADDLLDGPPSRLERDVLQVLTEASENMDPTYVVQLAQSMFVAPAWTQNYAGRVQDIKNRTAISAFLKANQMNVAQYDEFEPYDGASQVDEGEFQVDMGEPRVDGDVPRIHVTNERTHRDLPEFEEGDDAAYMRPLSANIKTLGVPFPNTFGVNASRDTLGRVMDETLQAFTPGYSDYTVNPYGIDSGSERSNGSVASGGRDSEPRLSRVAPQANPTTPDPYRSYFSDDSSDDTDAQTSVEPRSETDSESVNLRVMDIGLPPTTVQYDWNTPPPSVAPLNIAKSPVDSSQPRGSLDDGETLPATTYSPGATYAPAPAAPLQNDQVSPLNSGTIDARSSSVSISIDEPFGSQTQPTSYGSVVAAAIAANTAPVPLRPVRPVAVRNILDNYVERIYKVHDTSTGELIGGGVDANPLEVEIASLVLGVNILVRVADTDDEAKQRPPSSQNRLASREHAHPVLDGQGTINVIYRPGRFMGAERNAQRGFFAVDLGRGEAADSFYLAVAHALRYTDERLQSGADNLRERVGDKLAEILDEHSEQSEMFMNEILDDSVRNPKDRQAMSLLRDALGPYAMMSDAEIRQARAQATHGEIDSALLKAYERAFIFFMYPGERSDSEGSTQLQEELASVPLPHTNFTSEPDEQVAEDPHQQLDFLHAVRDIWFNVATYGHVTPPNVA